MKIYHTEYFPAIIIRISIVLFEASDTKNGTTQNLVIIHVHVIDSFKQSILVVLKVTGYRQPKGAWFARQLFLSQLLLLVSRV